MNDNKTEQNFKPTEEMLKVLEAFADMELKPTVSARMEKAGVGRTMWYEWLKIDGFMDWWDTETNKIVQSNIGELRKIGYMKSASDFRYWEAMMTKYDKYARRSDFTSNGEKIDGFFIMQQLGDELKQLTSEGESKDNS